MVNVTALQVIILILLAAGCGTSAGDDRYRQAHPNYLVLRDPGKSVLDCIDADGHLDVACYKP